MGPPDRILLSHLFLFEIPPMNRRVIGISDGGMNTYPDLNAKAKIIENAVACYHKIGVPQPRIAALAAVEAVNPDMQATLDAAALAKMNERGQIRGCIVDGPLALDNAVSEESAKIKGISSPVAGNADMLLVPDIESGNFVGKVLLYMTGGKGAGVIWGPGSPSSSPAVSTAWRPAAFNRPGRRSCPELNHSDQFQRRNFSMEQIRSLSQLLEYAKKIGAEKGPKKISVAMAEEAGLLSAIEEARQAGFAQAILVGNADKIKAAADQAGVNLANYEVIDERDEPAMGITAVSQVSSKKADIYMKGQIHTNNFLRAMLNKEVGLRKGKNTISHCYFHSVEGYDRIFFVSDAAFNMYPDLAAKADITQNHGEPGQGLRRGRAQGGRTRRCGSGEPRHARHPGRRRPPPR